MFITRFIITFFSFLILNLWFLFFLHLLIWIWIFLTFWFLWFFFFRYYLLRGITFLVYLLFVFIFFFRWSMVFINFFFWRLIIINYFCFRLWTIFVLIILFFVVFVLLIHLDIFLRTLTSRLIHNLLITTTRLFLSFFLFNRFFIWLGGWFLLSLLERLFSCTWILTLLTHLGFSSWYYRFLRFYNWCSSNGSCSSSSASSSYWRSFHWSFVWTFCYLSTFSFITSSAMHRCSLAINSMFLWLRFLLSSLTSLIRFLEF